MEPRNRCQGINSASLCSLAGRYDNPIPSRCLAPIEFLKIPAQYCTDMCRFIERTRKVYYGHCADVAYFLLHVMSGQSAIDSLCEEK
jgi:hypothetical protein